MTNQNPKNRFDHEEVTRSEAIRAAERFVENSRLQEDTDDLSGIKAMARQLVEKLKELIDAAIHL